jgi:hypothetical protein
MRENIRFLVFWARLTSLRMMFSNWEAFRKQAVHHLLTLDEKGKI